MKKYLSILLTLFSFTIASPEAVEAQPVKQAVEAQQYTPVKHYALGYKADKGFPKAVRAFEYGELKDTAVKQVVDLTAVMPPNDDQGQVGRCTGFGFAHGMYAAIKIATGQSVILSPNFIYYNERVVEGSVKQDSGAQLSDGVAVLKQYGAPLLGVWPTEKDFRLKPSAAAYNDGLKHLLLVAYKINNRSGQDVERAMSAGFPIVFGITLRADFESLDATHYLYRGVGQVIGGHCMMFYKYDLNRKVITGRNQWGDSWGNHDDFEMSIALLHSGAVDDCYALRLVQVK